ncbi:MAG: response regulator transcription factor [Ruminococcus sp.]|nr:response regulator transcription factor [Ruminococcus sp.]
MKILLAEDEKEMANAITAVLKHNHYYVDTVYNGEDAYNYGLADDYDCIVLDIMMPKMNGIDVLKNLRAKGIQAPVLFLTAKSDVDDRIEGLDAGADDYLTKPFAMGELLARIRAMCRRKSEIAPNDLKMGNVTLKRATFELCTQKGELRLASKEFQMLEMLMNNPNVLISTERFMEKIWGYDSESEINVVWVYISYLRKKLTQLDADINIKAVRGAGYTLEKKVK